MIVPPSNNENQLWVANGDQLTLTRRSLLLELFGEIVCPFTEGLFGGVLFILFDCCPDEISSCFTKIINCDFSLRVIFGKNEKSPFGFPYGT